MEYLTEKEAADFLGNAPRTLKWWRYKDTGPDYTTTPTGRIRYTREALTTYMTGEAA